MRQRRIEQKLKSLAKIKLENVSSAGGGDDLDIDPDKFHASALFNNNLKRLLKRTLKTMSK